MPDLRLPDLNTVIIAGRLTADPELRYLSAGTGVCDLRLASTRYYKSGNGERKEDTTFVEITAWGKTAEYAAENFKKGHPVLVDGRLKTDQWDDKTTGQKRSKVSIVADSIRALSWNEKKTDPLTPAPRTDTDEEAPF